MCEELRNKKKSELVKDVIQKSIKEMSQKTKKHTKYIYFISNGKCKGNSNIIAALIGKNWKFVLVRMWGNAPILFYRV